MYKIQIKTAYGWTNYPEIKRYFYTIKACYQHAVKHDLVNKNLYRIVNTETYEIKEV